VWEGKKEGWTMDVFISGKDPFLHGLSTAHAAGAGSWQRGCALA